jgi:hypothetical protein
LPERTSVTAVRPFAVTLNRTRAVRSSVNENVVPRWPPAARHLRRECDTFERTGACAGAIGEQLQCLRSGARTVRGNAERRHRQHDLPGDVEALAARREHPHSLARRHDGGDLAPAGFQQVLAVVKHDQRPLVPEMSDHGVLDRLAAALLHRSARAIAYATRSAL